MNKSSLGTFIFELLIFIICLIFYSTIWVVGYDARVFLVCIFIFCWIFRYERSKLLLEYYSHILTVSVYFLVISLIISISLRHFNIFSISMLSGVSWFVIITFIRFVRIRYSNKPYNILTHPGFVDQIPMSQKVNLTVKNEVLPRDLRDVQAVIISQNYDYSESWKNLILHANCLSVPIVTIDEYDEMIEQRLSLKKLNENWLYAGFSIPAWYRYSKAVVEFLFSILLIPILAVIFLIVGVVILMTMGGPIFYTQYRVGMNNKKFKVYKFRSMVNVKGCQGETLEREVRITRFGAIMRKYRIDELPQFLNILKGEMSLIGPRPEWVETANEFNKKIPLYSLRHLVKPGITGWAQVSQGHVVGSAENYTKLQYDLYYVKNFSLIMDLKVLIKTIYTILTGFGSR
jgi:lipopolysaccharide/colanic/teichoic acid biosynthesis glycosyltransferase